MLLNNKIRTKVWEYTKYERIKKRKKMSISSLGSVIKQISILPGYVSNDLKYYNMQTPISSTNDTLCINI